MSEEQTPTGGAPDPANPGGSNDLYMGKVRQNDIGIGARVPERVAEGRFASGAIVLEGPAEFVVDFVQGIARPPRVSTRVIVAPQVMGAFINALRDNMAKYEAAFGPPKPIPRPQTDRRPTIREIYDDLRLGDDVLCGSYATHVMIAHSPAEFYFDFITRFFPTAAVAARVYMAASQVPRLLDGMTMSFQNYQKRVIAQTGQLPPHLALHPPGQAPQAGQPQPPAEPQPPAGNGPSQPEDGAPPAPQQPQPPG